MPYYDIVDAETNEVLAENVFIPYSSGDGDSKLTDVLIFLLKLFFMIGPIIIYTILYPFLIFRDYKKGVFDLVESVFANPLTYIWITFITYLIVMSISKIKKYIKLKKIRNENNDSDKEDDITLKTNIEEKSTLIVFFEILKYIGYIVIGICVFIFLWSLFPFLPEIKPACVGVVSMIGSYVFIISLVFLTIKSYKEEDDKKEFFKDFFKNGVIGFFAIIFITAIILYVAMLFIKSDAGLLSLTMLIFNTPLIFAKMEEK